MLRKILSISGRPGLSRLVSQGRNMLIVEDLATGRRTPVHARDKVSSLADIAIYTLDDDRPLPEVLDALYASLEGKKADLATDNLPELLATALPGYDRERVHQSDIRRLFQWYNLLLDNGFTRFTDEAAEEEAPADEQ